MKPIEPFEAITKGMTEDDHSTFIENIKGAFEKINSRINELMWMNDIPNKVFVPLPGLTSRELAEVVSQYRKAGWVVNYGKVGDNPHITVGL